MTSLCETLESLAVRTWLYLDAAQQTEIRIGEETLTDINLIDIQDRHSAQVVTFKFPKHMEAANGADWEWWFLAAGSALGLRLQAKKLYPDGGYTSLYGRHRAQATTLIRASTADGLTPLFCFYNHRETPDRAEWPQLDSGTAIEQIGCAVASAHAVQVEIVFAHAAPTVDTLGRYQVPWRELVCVGSRDGEDSGREGEDGGDSEDGGGEDGGPVAPEPLYLIRDRLAELTAEHGAPEPRVISESEMPEYVALVRTREWMAYERKVPARRVTVIDLNQR